MLAALFENPSAIRHVDEALRHAIGIERTAPALDGGGGNSDDEAAVIAAEVYVRALRMGDGDEVAHYRNHHPHPEPDEEVAHYKKKPVLAR